MRLTLLGPQRRPTLDPVVRAYGPHARFAVGAGSLPFGVAVEVAVVLEVA